MRGDVLKVIDTHDVFSSIERKVRMFGVRDVVVDPHEEAERLRRGDLIIAIQDEERQELQRLAPGIPVVTAGVDFDVVADAAGSIAGRILFVASRNPRNRKGLIDFVRLAWPRIRRSVRQAELVVVGGVAAAVAGRTGPWRDGRRRVEDVAPLYREAALVINPVVAGTGAKIKTHRGALPPAADRHLAGRHRRTRSRLGRAMRRRPRLVRVRQRGGRRLTSAANAGSRRTIARSSPSWSRPRPPTPHSTPRTGRSSSGIGSRAGRGCRAASGGRLAMPAVAHAD